MLIKEYIKPDKYMFNDLDRRLTYKKNNNEMSIKKTGQLKLLFGEIQFLNYCNIKYLCDTNEQINILYIGSGKGYHIPILIDIYNYKNIEWHLYDPVGHCKSLYNYSNVNINNIIFDNSQIQKFKKIKNLIFISDIRSSDGNEPCTTNLLKDYDLQNYIVTTLNPMYSSLKFRYPFPNDWPDLINNKYYLKGLSFLQCYQPKYSAEHRVIVTPPYNYEKYNITDSEDYEEKFYYYNTQNRLISDKNISGYILNSANLYTTETLKDVTLKFKNTIKLSIING